MTTDLMPSNSIASDNRRAVKVGRNTSGLASRHFERSALSLKVIISLLHPASFPFEDKCLNLCPKKLEDLDPAAEAK